MLTYSKKKNKITLKYALTYFGEKYEKPKTDIVLEWQYSKKNFFSKEFHTIFIDLTKDEEMIFVGFEKNTKYEINRARNKDGIKILTLNEKEEKNSFYAFYNIFAASKKIPTISEEEINLLIENNMFKIRVALYNDEVLVYHSYIIANKRARLMQSASLFRETSDNAFKSLIGRTNRLLHWDDICYFKQCGFKIYDLGGVSIDKNNHETQAINKFKECFGGVLVKEYKSQIPVTFKGWIFLLAKKIIGKI